MRKVLVVEDETSIREMITLNLQMAGYAVAPAETAERGLELAKAAQPKFDIAVLDIMLPGMNGYSLCEQLRKNDSRMGIIMLSAKSQEADKVSGLAIGADDYMTKPFGVSELLARIEALCRRVGGGNPGKVAAPVADKDSVISGRFVLDERSRMLYKDGRPVELTQVEYQIMELFVRNAGSALKRNEILEAVWGKNYCGDEKIVDVNIRRLRMKVEDVPGNPEHILTVWGFGYRWTE